MSLKSFRQKKGWTQQQAATHFGLRSKGYYSRLENGREEPGIRLALRMQQLSGGEVKAAELCPDAAVLTAASEAQR